jgi:hypothetical protein
LIGLSRLLNITTSSELMQGTERLRNIGVVALLLAMSLTSATAGNEAKITEEQLACVGSATKEYLTTNAQFILRATGGGQLMSVEDSIAQRRLVESYCKQYAACLVSNIADAPLRESALRAMFATCLDDEAKEK